MKLCKVPGASQAASVDDELVMIHADTGKFFALKDTGLQIWQMLDSESDLDVIVSRLQQTYEVDRDVCRAQVAAFADSLVEAGFATYC